MKNFLLPAFLLLMVVSRAQDNGFPFGQVTYRDMEMKVYEKDSLADAVMLNEFGEAYIDNEYKLIFEYHAKIKILKKSGLKYADIEIPLLKDGTLGERLIEIKASAFTFENGSMIEIPVDAKNIFTEKRNEYVNVKKFAIPRVREGSVIEFQYILESPFLFKFRSWEIQTDIPKVKSEYWAKIPSNFLYNITLNGFLKLDKNESSVIDNHNSRTGSKTALIKFEAKNVPAFIEEDYMTAKSNYISAVNFELSEVAYPDGRVDKITKKWKDVEQELKLHNNFGAQIRRGKDIIEGEIKQLISGIEDPVVKAQKIYDFIRDWYQWDENYGKYSEFGIKKAFDQKKGNAADINLSLIAALKYASVNVEPVILSTRENGFPIELHPVLSDFNYVIAKINIGDKVYLADATDDFHPFGILPERCLNGKGRVLGEEESYWIDLKPADRAKKVSTLTLKLERDGVMRGSLQTMYMGYEAIRQRKKMAAFSTENEYIKDMNNKLDRIEIKGHEIQNATDLDKALIQKLNIEIQAFDNPGSENFLFNPFILGKWEENPFRSQERLYPVDFGTPMESITIFNLEYPEEYEIINLPEKIGLLLPNSGGRFIYDAQNINNKLTLNNSLVISRTLFTATEYHYLKELFNRVVQAQNGDLIFKKKP